ncbi:MAG: hypothetical protein IPP14_03095 [Planctomycetes bacterium]|nr:hypothetical protein [Planctomycetota bacterium]
MAQRFVILRHSVNGGEHFDLMLEAPGEPSLITWQLATWPLEPGAGCAAKSLGPHRLAYLTYEGEVSHGRGSVTRVDQGDWYMEANLIVLRADLRLQIEDGTARRV